MLVVKVILILKMFGPERNAIEGNLALKGLIIIAMANEYAIASLNPMNSVAELLPTWLAWRED